MSINNRRRNFRSRSQKNNFRRRSNIISTNNASSLTSNGNVNFNRNGSMNNLHAVEKTMQKFQQLAKDAQSNGDPVLAQNYLQHADHYLRRFNELSQKRDVAHDQSQNLDKESASTTN
tara:strand:- start:229 stop:582 length:354 start_codon:yes stop_codon:yes gene_type:complete